MSDIVIYGASDQGRCTLDVVEREGRHRVVGFFDDWAEPGAVVAGLPVLGGGDAVVAQRRRLGFDGIIVAIGDNHGRGEVVARLEGADPGLRFPTAIDPSAVVGREVTIGEGSVLMAGVIVNGSSAVGRHALLCAGASLDHDATLGDFASLGPAAVTGGRVEIGHHTAIGLGARVIHRRTIGAQTVIGAGATVVRDIPDLVVAYGTPCRVVRSRAPGDRYL